MRDTLPVQEPGEAHWVPADREQKGEHVVPQENATPTQRVFWVEVHAESTSEVQLLQLEHTVVPVVEAL